jgi:hypothetical protein
LQILNGQRLDDAQAKVISGDDDNDDDDNDDDGDNDDMLYIAMCSVL